MVVHGDQIYVDFIRFLIREDFSDLYAWCLRYNICSTWFLNIRISTCSYNYDSLLIVIMYICHKKIFNTPCLV